MTAQPPPTLPDGVKKALDMLAENLRIIEIHSLNVDFTHPSHRQFQLQAREASQMCDVALLLSGSRTTINEMSWDVVIGSLTTRRTDVYPFVTTILEIPDYPDAKRYRDAIDSVQKLLQPTGTLATGLQSATSSARKKANAAAWRDTHTETKNTPREKPARKTKGAITDAAVDTFFGGAHPGGGGSNKR